MRRATPEAAFSEAAAAMQRGDWHAFFACIDRDSLRTIVENGVARFLAGGAASAPVLADICVGSGVPRATIDDLQSASSDVVESARAMMARGGPRDPKTMLDDSRRHRALVDRHRAMLKSIAGAAGDLSRLAADLEIALRQASGSGSVSSRLFVGETLDGVSVAGSRATAVRRISNDATEDVAFVRRSGEWFIKPFAKPRR